jgi:hypothetical protein
LSIRHPLDVRVGDVLRYRSVVTDDTLVEPFVNEATITVTAEQESRPGPHAPKSQPSSTEGNDAEAPIGIDLPIPKLITEDEWPKHRFDQFSACRIVQDESEDDPDREIYDFYINVDNVYLRNEMKNGRQDAAVQRARFVFGNVLIALALIRQHAEQQKRRRLEGGRRQEEDDGEATIEEQVALTTTALGPFILPMIESLGSLSDVDQEVASYVGDDD